MSAQGGEGGAVLALVMQVLALVFSGVSMAAVVALAYNFGRRSQRQDRAERDLNEAWTAIRALGGPPRGPEGGR